MYGRPCLPLCPHCHEPTSPADLDGLTDAAAGAGGLPIDAEVCRSCRRVLESQADDDALDNDEDFAAICDARRESAIEHMIATGYGDEPAMPWSLAWCEADALTPAVSL